ncbi:ATPase [Gregarina niphandrodes]|uniref:ATPase ASNA1 homolog n=1 Tax=Gregarina niphandrodes TaxID=110365 RepID=A0A023AYS6_GRENI|nr:ATPase [Gregarina niphandrodes]EZG43821.1 ATPase [Gregarina niphandrodes]|eukprot:XP_011132976.1 ATPase [Gregarina niphandrodes]
MSVHSDHFTDCDEDSFEEVLDPTLESLVNSTTLQWIFVGGKGGVGKTTTSCSLAIELSNRRESVLILSTDPAHNLSDAFGQKFSSSPTRVNGFSNLFAMEIDSSMKTSTGFQLSDDDDELGLGRMIPEMIQAFPGIDEAMSFGELMKAVQTMNYSCIVFDTAPTGHTLRLLSFPNLLEKAFGKFNELGSKLGGMMDMISGGGGDDSGIMSKIEHMRAVTLSVKKLFKDPTRTTFVCVCIPEFLSLYETERLVQELAKQEIDARYIVVNQIVFPIEGYEDPLTSEQLQKQIEMHMGTTDDSVKVIQEYKKVENKANQLQQAHEARRKMQSKYLSQIRDLYAYDFHVVPMPLRTNEVRGLKNLKTFGESLLTKRDLPIFE